MPRDAVSRTANVGAVGKNGLKERHSPVAGDCAHLERRGGKPHKHHIEWCIRNIIGLSIQFLICFGT